MTETTKHPAYLALKLDEDSNRRNAFSYSTNLESVRAWARGENESDNPEEETTGTEPPEPLEAPLKELMNRLTETGLALSELILATSSVKSLFSTIVSRMEVIDPVKENCPIVEKDDNYEIYGISSDRHLKIKEQHRRLERMDRGFDLLPSAVLLTIVATFDSAIADIVRRLLQSKPERFDSGDRTMKVSDILGMKSFDDVKSKLIDDEVYLFSRDSHEEQVKYIERSFHISIISHWKRWPDFIEIFERRNLIAHGEVTFTERYASICKRCGHKGSDKLLGKEIKLTLSYLKQSLDTLMEFATLLLFSVWRKQFPDQEQDAFQSINDFAYRMISDERYTLPVRILEYVLALKGATVTQSTRLMLTVNLASAYRHHDQHEKSKELLDSVDWSAVSDDYQICVAALRGEIDKVCDLMPRVMAASSVRKVDFREWPVFDYVRDEAAFREKFLELFGEPIAEGPPSSAEFHSEDAVVAEVSEAEETMH